MKKSATIQKEDVRMWKPRCWKWQNWWDPVPFLWSTVSCRPSGVVHANIGVFPSTSEHTPLSAVNEDPSERAIRLQHIGASLGISNKNIMKFRYFFNLHSKVYCSLSISAFQRPHQWELLVSLQILAFFSPFCFSSHVVLFSLWALPIQQFTRHH